MRFQFTLVGLLLLLVSAWASADDQPASPDVRKLLGSIATKCDGAKTYSFEGDLQVDGQRGDIPGRILSKAKVKLAVAPGGKYFLNIEPIGKDEYMLVSDGQKTWAYVPRLKQYTETEGGTVEVDAGDEDTKNDDSSEERDLAETFSHLVMPALSQMVKTAESAAAKPPMPVKFEGRKYTWPVIQVLSKKSSDGQYLTEVTVDPETLRIGRLLWATVSYRGSERSVIRMTVDFSSFKIGEPLPDSNFVFEAPKKAKLVDAVPIPGQTGSFLLNRQAPDFEAKTLDGERVHLAELRDRPVLLNFWASWCGPCRRELPSVVKLHEELKSKGLVVLGVNDEGKGTAQTFADKVGLTFPTLDDSRLKLHRLYRVSNIPSIFIIDRDGKVVRFLRGAHDEAELRAALKSAGF
jgi:peroxiredoxin/outer membrane lipoprotein-sorting protein